MEDIKPKLKDQILHLLKMQGAQTATALAEQLQVSPMAIRQHPQTLKTEQWGTYQEERRSLGRPVKLWQLTPQAVDRFPHRHAELLVDLLRSMQTLFGAEGLDRLVAERSRRQTQLYREQIAEMAGSAPWEQQVAVIASLRTQEGYMAEVIQQPDGTLLLVENHCPICAAAQTCQSLCRAELEVFQSVLGSTLRIERVEHMLRGDRRCAYRIGLQ